MLYERLGLDSAEHRAEHKLKTKTKHTKVNSIYISPVSSSLPCRLAWKTALQQTHAFRTFT